MTTRQEIYLSLGSNVGDREANLKECIGLLEQQEYIQLTQYSSLYETKPVGFVEQSDFLNMVVRGVTSLSPKSLLLETQKCEQQLGRKRETRWGPRTIDVDILLYNKQRINIDDLIIPHPRMKERAFVIIPLAEISPELIIPGEEITIQQMAPLLQGEGVYLWKRIGHGEKGLKLFES